MRDWNRKSWLITLGSERVVKCIYSGWSIFVGQEQQSITLLSIQGFTTKSHSSVLIGSWPLSTREYRHTKLTWPVMQHKHLLTVLLAHLYVCCKRQITYSFPLSVLLLSKDWLHLQFWTFYDVKSSTDNGKLHVNLNPCFISSDMPTEPRISKTKLGSMKILKMLFSENSRKKLRSSRLSLVMQVSDTYLMYRQWSCLCVNTTRSVAKSDGWYWAGELDREHY